jgi:hypothetical protein
MQAIKHEKNAVLIKDNQVEVWVDVWVSDGDVNVEWNKYIFFDNDPRDVAIRSWQDDFENFEEASSLAISTLEDAGMIKQLDNGRWVST